MNAGVQSQTPGKRPGVTGQSGRREKHFTNQFLKYSQGVATGAASSGKNLTKQLIHRHLASLDFLLNIPMMNEASIKENGIMAMKKKDHIGQGGNLMTDSHHNNENAANNNYSSESIELQVDDISPDAPGKKLPGVSAMTVKVPLLIKYQIQKNTEKSARYIEWTDQLLLGNGNEKTVKGENKNVMNSRLFFCRSRSYPLAIFSVIKYDAEKEKQRRKLADSAPFEVFDIYKQGYRAAGRDDWRGATFEKLLDPFKLQENVALDQLDKGYMYDPVSLDDPALIYGDDRWLMKQQENIEAPVVISLIKYVNKDVLKLKLNEKFRDTHSNIPASLTLSKIRNLKKKAVLLALALNLELATIAVAVICFERLCLKSIISKENRKLAMAVCILLAFKFGDPLGFILHKDEEKGSNIEESKEKNESLENLFDYFDKEWEITRKQIKDAEFGVFALLDFSLHLPRVHVDWVFNQLLRMVNKNSSNYLFDNDYDMNEMYVEDVNWLELTKQELLEAREEENEAENEMKEGLELSSDLQNDCDGVDPENSQGNNKYRNHSASIGNIGGEGYIQEAGSAGGKSNEDGDSKSGYLKFFKRFALTSPLAQIGSSNTGPGLEVPLAAGASCEVSPNSSAGGSLNTPNAENQETGSETAIETPSSTSASAALLDITSS